MLLDWQKWADDKKLDTLSLPGTDGYSVLYPTRGFTCIPDSNPDSKLKGYTKEYQDMVRFMGGGSYHKVDKEGRPIFIERIGLYDTKNWEKSTTPENWM